MTQIRFRLIPGALVWIVVLAIIEAIKTFVESADFGIGVSTAASVGCALVTTLITGFRDAMANDPQSTTPYHRSGYYYPPPAPGRTYRPQVAQRRGSPAIVAVVVLALLAGGAYGGTKLWRYVAGSESGVERMASPPAKGTAGPLTATVQGVEVTPNFIKVKLNATNKDPDPITIAVNDQWCKLVGADGSALSPYGGISGLTDNIEVPGSNVPVTEVITFKGHPATTTFVLSFSSLFGTFKARSLQIKEIKLTPV